MRLLFLVDGGGMVFDRSAEVRPIIEEFYDYGIMFCEDLDDCWQTKDVWDGLITELFNGGGTDITSDDNSFLFKWLSLKLKHRLSWVRRLPIPFECGMMNSIWFRGSVVCMLFCLLGAFFLRDNCSRVYYSEPGIKFITRFLTQYNLN